MSQLVDRTGQKYGRLTVIKRAPNKIYTSGRSVVMWECVCDCGNSVTVAATSLQSGATTSCGCWNDEQRKNPKPNIKPTVKETLDYIRFGAV